MSERKRNKNKERYKVKTFPVPFALKEVKENHVFNTNIPAKPSKEELITQAFQFHLKGNIQVAQKYYKSFIAQGFKDDRVYFNYGTILKDLGNLKDAEESYRKAIEIKPELPNVHLNLGSVLEGLGKSKEAEISTRKAIELKPDFAEAYSNLGTILKDLGNLKDAEESYRKAIELKPDFAEAHSNLGIILIAHGKLKEAEISTRKAIELKPDFAEAYTNLGTISIDHGNLKDAEIFTRRAIQLNPNFDIANYNLGTILKNLGNLKDAEIFTRRAIQLNPDNAEAYSNLGNILKDAGKSKDSNKQYNIALEKEPNNIFNIVQVKLKLSAIMKDSKQIDIERKTYKQELEKIKNNKDIYFKSNQIFDTNMFYLAYQNRLDDKMILEELSRTISKIKGILFEGFSKIDYIKNSSKRTNLKVGICSECFRKNHTIGKLYIKVLLDLLKTNVDIIIYVPTSASSNSGLELIENSFKRVIILPTSIPIAGEIISSEKLDLLFYPDIGMSNFTYLLALSRLALVQVTSLGHPNTSGIKNIDYFITNDTVPHHPTSSYTERLIKFSRLPFNYPTPKINESKLTSKIILNSDNNFIIGLTQSPFKLHPDFDQVLESILSEIKNAYLILLKDKQEYNTRNLKNRWKGKSNLLLERSIFLDKMSKDDFINTTKNCHIMLDPFYFGSGNTFYEAMAFGIPFITYPFSQRGSLVASGYKQMGVKNPPIAESPEDYINWCKKYANNRLFLKNTKDELKERAQKYLFNDNEIYKEYYIFFTEAVKAARKGEFLEDNWKPFSPSKN